MSDGFATAKEAKDFLVGKVVAQAAREDVPLSERERKLMYYSVEDPSSQTSEEECGDDPESETKVSDLIARAYKNDSEKGRFKAAFKKLSEGDHYLSVMNPFTGVINDSESTPVSKSGPLMLTALAVVAGMFLIAAYWQPVKESFWHWLRNAK